MSDKNKVRLAHNVLDGLSAGRILSRENEQLLRSFLPELPAQKTLAEIIAHVDDAWSVASGNDWGGNSYNPNISIEDWLTELHEQLKGLIYTPDTVPALPDGMRLAEHAVYGRVVTSPKPNRDGIYDLLVPKPKFETGADWEYAHECELTFIDAEPAKPAHPEFLETEANYQNAPAGTVAAKDGWLAWIKQKNGDWSCDGGSEGGSILAQTGKRRVLRWGWTNE